MTDSYEGNGDYAAHNDGSSDFKRKSGNSNDKDIEEHEEDTSRLSEKANEYIRELLSERVAMERKYPCADRLIENEIHKTQQAGRPPARDIKYDIYREKQVKVTVKVLVPVREHPKFNFVGKLLGPKGNSMKRLQEETMCKMAVLGRGSMKDRKKEEEFRAALDPKYAHLNDDLHVEISALGPPAEAHARIAFALAEVRKYLIPDSNDRIRQEQREMMTDGHESLDEGTPPPPPTMHYKKAIPPPYRAPPHVPTNRARVAMEESRSSKSILPHHVRYEDPSHYDHYEYYHHPPVHPPPPPRPKYEVPDYVTDYRVSHGEYYREPPTYPVKSGTSGRSWKTASSSSYSSSREEEIPSRHSHSRDTRYRHSPYTRPTK